MPGPSRPPKDACRESRGEGWMSPLQTALGVGGFVVLLDLVIRLVALVVIPRNRLPTAAMAWLLAVFFIPVIGVILFLLIGSPKLPKERRRKQIEMNAVIVEESKDVAPGLGADPEPEWLEQIV